MKKVGKRAGVAILLGGMAASLSSFAGPDGPASNPPAAVASQPVAKSVAVAPVVPSKRRLAHVNLVDETAIAAQKGWLQEEFNKYNADVDLVQPSSYGGSGTIAALFDRGDLHIGLSMVNGAIQNRVKGLDTVLIFVTEKAVPRRAVTAVLETSKIRTSEDLRGKTLGGQIINCPYYASVESLRSKGLSVDNDLRKGDLRFLNISGAPAISAFLSGQYDAMATHPASATLIPLYLQGQVREVLTAVPDGNYVTTGGRSAWTAERTWAKENPDLVKAFLTVLDRTTTWLYADVANQNEGARITARELRYPAGVAKYLLKDESRTAFAWGTNDYEEAFKSVRGYIDYNRKEGDPFFKKFDLTDAEIRQWIDRRFFKGGEYFVDVSPKAKK